MNTNGTSLRYEHGEYSFNTMFSAHEGEKASSFNGYFCALDNLDKPFMDAGMQRQLLEESEKQLDTVSPSEKFVGKVIYSPTVSTSFCRRRSKILHHPACLLTAHLPGKTR